MNTASFSIPADIMALRGLSFSEKGAMAIMRQRPDDTQSQLAAQIAVTMDVSMATAYAYLRKLTFSGQVSPRKARSTDNTSVSNFYNIETSPVSRKFLESGEAIPPAPSSPPLNGPPSPSLHPSSPPPIIPPTPPTPPVACAEPEVRKVIEAESFLPDDSVPSRTPEPKPEPKGKRKGRSKGDRDYSWEPFAALWAIYPRRNGEKRNIAPAYDKLLKLNPSEELVEIIEADIQYRLKHDNAWRRGFPPDFSVYLNQSLYEDEIARRSGATEIRDIAPPPPDLSDIPDPMDALIAAMDARREAEKRAAEQAEEWAE